LLLFANTLEFKIKLTNMNNLIIDAANDKIFFIIIADNKLYTSEFSNNRENFDKLVILVVKFLENHHLNIKNLNNIFVNQGPGKFSGIRASLAIAKALSFANKIDLYGFSSEQVIDKNYVKIIELFNKGLLNKNLIKPQY
jgi:tRNA A37 threonylcarbamoyladenosine modification protein TsaB